MHQSANTETVNSMLYTGKTVQWEHSSPKFIKVNTILLFFIRDSGDESVHKMPTDTPHLHVSSRRCSWRPLPPWTRRLWAALPAGRAEPPGSLCSRRRHGCSLTYSPSSSPSPCVRKEASSRCCWRHSAAAGGKTSGELICKSHILGFSSWCEE